MEMNVDRLVVILFLLFFGELRSADHECGIQNFQDKIINGNETAIDEYPWTVLIRYKHKTSNRENWGCGGSLIGTKTVITAAHCVDDMAVAALGHIKFVRLGEYDYSKDIDCVKIGAFKDCADAPVDIKVSKIIIHPERNSNSKLHDIAILVLEKVTPYTDFIRPICLPGHTFSLDDIDRGEAVLFVTGWGWTIGSFQSPSSVKRDTSVNYVDTKECRHHYRDINEKLQLCAGGENGQNACRGDSGGPLMYAKDNKWTLTGIVSFGPLPCGRVGFDGTPAVFTRISSYLSWIKIVLLDQDMASWAWDK